MFALTCSNHWSAKLVMRQWPSYSMSLEQGLFAEKERNPLQILQPY